MPPPVLTSSWWRDEHYTIYPTCINTNSALHILPLIEVMISTLDIFVSLPMEIIEVLVKSFVEYNVV